MGLSALGAYSRLRIEPFARDRVCCGFRLFTRGEPIALGRVNATDLADLSAVGRVLVPGADRQGPREGVGPWEIQ